MSLVDCWVLPHEVIVAVDTDATAKDGSRTVASKLLAVPHLNAVIAGRGQGSFFDMVFLGCLSGFESFDEMLVDMPDNLQRVDRILPAELITRNGAAGNELIAVGWSGKQGRMIGRSFTKRQGMESFAEAEFGTCISPWDSSMPDIPHRPAALDKIARAQVQWIRSAGPGHCGGNLITARITKNSLTMSHKAIGK